MPLRTSVNMKHPQEQQGCRFTEKGLGLRTPHFLLVPLFPVIPHNIFLIDLNIIFQKLSLIENLPPNLYPNSHHPVTRSKQKTTDWLGSKHKPLEGKNSFSHVEI